MRTIVQLAEEVVVAQRKASKATYRFSKALRVVAYPDWGCPLCEVFGSVAYVRDHILADHTRPLGLADAPWGAEGRP